MSLPRHTTHWASDGRKRHAGTVDNCESCHGDAWWRWCDTHDRVTEHVELPEGWTCVPCAIGPFTEESDNGH